MHPDTIVTPILHLNGDRKDTLIAALTQAYHATRAAEKAVQACAGNLRNFYPEAGRWERYRAQHAERVAHLHSLLDSLVKEVARIEVESRTQDGS